MIKSTNPKSRFAICSKEFQQYLVFSQPLTKAVGQSVLHKYAQSISPFKGQPADSKPHEQEALEQLAHLDHCISHLAHWLGQEGPHQLDNQIKNKFIYIPFFNTSKNIINDFKEIKEIFEELKKNSDININTDNCNIIFQYDVSNELIKKLNEKLETFIPKLIEEIQAIRKKIKASTSYNPKGNKLIVLIKKILKYIKELFSPKIEIKYLLSYTDHLEKSLKKIKKYIAETVNFATINQDHLDEYAHHATEIRNDISEKFNKAQETARKAFAKLAGYLEGFETIEALKGKTKRHILKAILGGVACAALGSLLGLFIGIIGLSSPFAIPILLAMGAAIALGFGVYQLVKAIQTRAKRQKIEASTHNIRVDNSKSMMEQSTRHYTDSDLFELDPLYTGELNIREEGNVEKKY